MTQPKYVYKVSRYGQVEIERAEVERETPKLYILTKSFPAANYKTSVPKDEVYLTPEAAAEGFLEAQKRKIKNLRNQIHALGSRMGQVPRALKWIKGAEEDEWIACEDELPPTQTVVMTKIDDGKGGRNKTQLYRGGPKGNMWFVPEGAMYVYYTPTHWKRLDDLG